jgi:hypothetical protein
LGAATADDVAGVVLRDDLDAEPLGDRSTVGTEAWKGLLVGDPRYLEAGGRRYSRRCL